MTTSQVLAERKLLSSLLLDPDVWIEYARGLDQSYFSLPVHQIAYQALVNAHLDEREVDLVIVMDEVEHLTEDITVQRDAIDAFTDVGTNVTEYVRIVKDRYTRRLISDVADDLSRKVMQLDSTANEALDMAFAQLATLDPEKDEDSNGFNSLITKIEQGVMAPSVKTGFTDFDQAFGGFYRSKLLMIAGRPKMGKTAMLTCLTDRVLEAGQRVGFISAEMDRESILARIVAGRAGLDFTSMTQGEMCDSDWARFYQSVGELSQAKLVIDDTPDMTVSRAIMTSWRWHYQEPLDLLMVDHLHELAEDDVPKAFATNENRSYGWMTKMLRNRIARKLRIPLVCAAQLNRGVEGRSEKRPRSSDVRGSGMIEQIVDSLVLLHRDDYYHPETSERKNIAEMIMDVNRSGPSGMVDLYWDAPRLRFRNLKRLEISL